MLHIGDDVRRFSANNVLIFKGILVALGFDI